jgi:hypothetical protein
MHRGFNFKSTFNSEIIGGSLKKGEEIYENIKKISKLSLDKYISPDGSIDASKMQEDWFPQERIAADVFISHSHKDKSIAISLAGWLYEEFELKCFIDSCIWGYANELLKSIDNKYCWTDDKHETYNYNNRNYSTSHIHVMLSSALSKMMDKSECLFFINTRNSITPKGIIEQTESPWIYSEITMSQLLKRNPTGRVNLTEDTIFKSFSARSLVESMPAFKYKVGLSHLTEIDETNLSKWYFSKNQTQHPLDILYAQNPNRNL